MRARMPSNNIVTRINHGEPGTNVQLVQSEPPSRFDDIDGWAMWLRARSAAPRYASNVSRARDTGAGKAV